jgi:hypothetical protein
VIGEKVLQLWRGHGRNRLLPVVQLVARRKAAAFGFASWVSEQFGVQLYRIRSGDTPASPTEREALARLLERETVLTNCAYFVDVSESAGVFALVESLQAPMFVESAGQVLLPGRQVLRLELAEASRNEQKEVWLEGLGTHAARVNGGLDRILDQFNLTPDEIEGAALAAAPTDGEVPDDGLEQALWTACRDRARPQLENLTQRIEARASWADLVLPRPQIETLQTLSTHVRNQGKVYGEWGFARKSARGLGISALFVGASGTGKTMTAEVLANELQLDLYRIDLSQVVSKYIGETEKNLKRIFDAAESGGAILLFDEADAIFGKRSEVKDSHDRYANIEVSYLLQRMEAYRGLAILTTNMKQALDPAFLRRIRFVVQFPFPDAAQRAEIWRRMFPEKTPTEGLDCGRLGRLNVPGGNIRNIALNAAFLAADAGEPVRMAHILRAARSEYAKIEKPLTETEAGGFA